MSWRNELLRATTNWDPVDCPCHHSLRATTTRIYSTWLSHGYGLYITCYFMPILSCSLCMLCLLLCLCHLIVTLACNFPWFKIMLLLCVFACLVEILVAIAMFIMCLVLLMLFCSYPPFMLVICIVHYSCPPFAHMTYLTWFFLVCCIFAILACLPWFPWLLALSHHPCSILPCFLGLMTYMFMPLTWYILFIVACLQLLLLCLLIMETWTLYLWCMLAWLSLLYLVVLASSYASILWSDPLSFLWWAWCIHLLGILPHEW